MRTKTKILVALSAVAAAALISGASILAATSLGTTSDPLVTLSYLTSKFKPQVLSEVSALVDQTKTALAADLDAKISGFKADIDAKLAGSQVQQVGFVVVTLSKNQTLSCAAGSEVLLRVGTATAVGSAPALVDSTSGATLSSGGALVPNHMYLVTIQGNGLKATANTVKVLVRGAYVVG